MSSRRKRTLTLFVAITVLVLAQIVWWTIVFVQGVDRIAHLENENHQLRIEAGKLDHFSKEAIEKEAINRRFMFLSESITFGFLTCIGLYLLFHALRSEAQSRLIQKNFIEMISHESKTPLTALKLRLESVYEKNPGLGDLKLAMAEVRRLSSILEKALHWTRVERQALQFEVLTVSELIDDVVKRLEPFLSSENAKLHLELNRDAKVKGDHYGLENSFQSLIENAVLHNDAANKEIFVRLGKGIDSVLLEVWDNGSGIPDADRARVFERFYRGKSGKRVAGTGLGLYIVKNIVEAHRGRIQLKDRNRFELFLPGVA